MERIREVVTELRDWNVGIDTVALEFTIRRRLEGSMAELLENPENVDLLSEVILLMKAIVSLPMDVNLWQPQNMFWALLHSRTSDLTLSDEAVGRNGPPWIETLRALGEQLYFNIDAQLVARGDV